MAPITPEAAARRPSSGSTPSGSLLGAPPLLEASADLGGDSQFNGDHGSLSPSPSMINALERGTVMHIREQTAERLVSTLQVRPRLLLAAVSTRPEPGRVSIVDRQYLMMTIPREGDAAHPLWVLRWPWSACQVHGGFPSWVPR